MDKYEFKEKLKEGDFTIKELDELQWKYDFIKKICKKEEIRQWSKEVSYIFKFEEKLYCLDYSTGFIPWEENEYFRQPYEVDKNVSY